MSQKHTLAQYPKPASSDSQKKIMVSIMFVIVGNIVLPTEVELFFKDHVVVSAVLLVV